MHEALYHAIVYQNPAAMWVLDRSARIFDANTAFANLVGYSLAEIVGRPFAQLLPQSHRRQAWRQFALLARRQEPRTNASLVMVHRFGHEVRIGFKAIPVQHQGRFLGAVLEARELAEAEQDRNWSRRSDRLEVISQLAAGVAHEIRNPLTTLKGFAQFLMDQPQATPRFLAVLQEEVAEIERVVNNFVELANPHWSHFVRVDVSSLIEDVVGLMEPQGLLQNVWMDVGLVGKSLVVPGAPAYLKRVFTNIVENAIQAMPNGGLLHIRAKRETRQGQQKVVIFFTDEGKGMSQDRLAKLGEPSYKLDERGTGLGLLIGQHIVQRHNGELHVRSQVGWGTEVQLILPYAGEPAGLLQ
ncbi:PAS domain S-box protein [Alicyclobacillaceae bacterium I2511]|nr:PAS domain S-box protein [Alicyclobacillaceae bacterium I2511]